MPISQLLVGDVVLAYDEASGEVGEYSVIATISHEDESVVYLTIDGEQLITTADHPFYTSTGEWIEAGELALGDEVWSLAGDYGQVEAITVTDAPQRMYNLISHKTFIERICPELA